MVEDAVAAGEPGPDMEAVAAQIIEAIGGDAPRAYVDSLLQMSGGDAEAALLHHFTANMGEVPPSFASGGGSDDDEDDDDDQPDLVDTAGDSARVSSGVAELELNQPQRPAYRLNLGHQEINRVVKEVEDYCDSVIQSAGADAWMPVHGLEQLLLKDLGYGDSDEFEDALGGSFVQFLEALPHVETKVQDDGSSVDGKLVMRMVPPPAPEMRRPMTLRLTIRRSEDLWRTLMKAPSAVIQIPAIEFEIGMSERRQTDSVYNHITTACFNLSMHARSQNENTKAAIIETVDELTRLLDIPDDVPWVLEVKDPGGESMFKPDEGVETIYGAAEGEVPLGSLPEVANEA